MVLCARVGGGHNGRQPHGMKRPIIDTRALQIGVFGALVLAFGGFASFMAARQNRADAGGGVCRRGLISGFGGSPSDHAAGRLPHFVDIAASH